MKKIALVVALASGACNAHAPGTAHVMRVTDQGGTVRLAGGDLDEAARAAAKAIRAECGEQFTVVAIEDAQGAPRTPVASGEYGGITYIPTVWRDLTYACGGAGKASPLTARFLSWAEKADAVDAAVQAKEASYRKSLEPYPCGPFDVCERGGLCVENMCQQ